MMPRPIHFNDLLKLNGLLDVVYNGLSDPDMSVVVMHVLDVLKKSHNLPAVNPTEGKCENKSTAFRNEGNRAYARSAFQTALICYNRALLYAPQGSRALKLAYSNRSALLFKVKAYQACLNDIDTCFSLSCPPDIIAKLRSRKEEAESNMWIEKLAEYSNRTEFTAQYFMLHGRQNPQIPCASLDVGVIMENEVPKVVAATDIKVGAVIAVETAVVAKPDSSNARFCCYYCHKMPLNLHPCRGCCCVLFCDEICRNLCMAEYHGIECKLLSALDNLAAGTWLRVALKAVLKMKQMSSWPELIAESHKMGMSRIKTSSINEIYDSRNKFSLLNAKDDRHFLHGPLYNYSIKCAFIIYFLGELSGFYPQLPEERKEAKCAIARLLMFLSLYSYNNLIVPSATLKVYERTDLYDIPNIGWFSFLGKIRTSCHSNVLVVGLNRQIALVAQQPIKRGTELTVSSPGHWLDTSRTRSLTQSQMFLMNGIVCNCMFCNRDSSSTAKVDELTELQKRTFRKLNIFKLKEEFNARNLPEIYSKLCKMLAILHNVPFSDEYKTVYRFFRRCVLFLQDVVTENCILNYE